MGLLTVNRVILCFAAIGLGCAPDFEVDLALVDRPRVLALASTPAEAAPGEVVMLTALVATPGGTSGDAALDWSTCLARRPLAESSLGSLSTARHRTATKTTVVARRRDMRRFAVARTQPLAHASTDD